MKLIKISAVWCPACLIMNSRINKITNKLNIPVIEYDYDIDNEIIKKYNIGNILPVIILEEDKEIDRLVGEHSDKEIERFLNR